MKLFVVGEDTPDPEKWSDWSEWSLVIAEDEVAARVTAGEGPTAKVCAIPMDKRLHLVSMPEPAWGDDI